MPTGNGWFFSTSQGILCTVTGNNIKVMLLFSGQKGVNAVESLREKLLALIRTIPEDKLQVIFDFVNRMAQDTIEGEDYDQLLMEDHTGC